MTRRRKRINTIYLLLSAVFLILMSAGAIYFAKTYKPPSPEEYLERVTKYLEEFASDLDVSPQMRESIYWDWIDENNIQLPLTGNQFLLGTVDVSGIGKYGTITSDNLEKINNKFFGSILEAGDEFFEKNRFASDVRNSRQDEKNPLHETYRGYEKGPIKCLIRLTPQSDPFGTIFCGIVDEKQIKLQKEFSSLFSTTYNPKKYASFRVDVAQDNFARGNLSESVLGYVWIARKDDAKWKIVWRGNEVPLCSAMEAESIPKSVYLNCYQE